MVLAYALWATIGSIKLKSIGSIKLKSIGSGEILSFTICPFCRPLFMGETIYTL